MRPGQAFEDRLVEGHARMTEPSDYDIVKAYIEGSYYETPDGPLWKYEEGGKGEAKPMALAALDRLNALLRQQDSAALGEVVAESAARIKELEGALERVTMCSSLLTAKGLADQALAPSRETE